MREPCYMIHVFIHKKKTEFLLLYIPVIKELTAHDNDGREMIISAK